MEENKENVVEETTQDNVTKVEIKNTQEEENIVKVNLDKPVKPEENETKEDNADDSGVVELVENTESTEKQEEVQPEAETQKIPVLEEITEESTEEKVV